MVHLVFLVFQVLEGKQDKLEVQGHLGSKDCLVK